ncbi:MAG TPA: hypothetical protein VGU66_22610 [Candidatus Elarobacter sp.]|nr:hypothetical protein [Candidatus Elarobacter sp.]
MGKSAGNDLDALSANVPLPVAAGIVTAATVARPRVGNVVVLAVVANGTVAVTDVAGAAVGAGDGGTTAVLAGPHPVNARVMSANASATGDAALIYAYR